MIPLPPGAKRFYEIRFRVKQMTDEIGDWFNLIGGRAWAEQEHDYRGRQVLHKFVQYGRAKRSHHLIDGSNSVLIRFNGEDASAASMFLIKFFDLIEEHNMQDYLSYE